MSKFLRVNSKETFIEKAKYVHGDTYGYENVKYEGSKKNSSIKMPFSSKKL